MEYAKILTKKHGLGNLKCDEVVLEEDKYDDDIHLVMKYADSVHPFKLVIEFCQKFKWSHPQIDTFSIGTNENPMFKTTISVKNNKYKGEAEGNQKKVSKSNFYYLILENAAIIALNNMLEDSLVRDSMKIFVKSLMNKKEDDARALIKNNIEEGDLNSNIIKEDNMLCELNEEDEIERVEKTLREYHQNNPLIKLNFFKNKVKIPFSFTYTHKGSHQNRLKVATLYVGSEICKYFIIFSWSGRRQKY
jgi:hypothetical protein